MDTHLLSLKELNNKASFHAESFIMCELSKCSRGAAAAATGGWLPARPAEARFRWSPVEKMVGPWRAGLGISHASVGTGERWNGARERLIVGPVQRNAPIPLPTSILRCEGFSEKEFLRCLHLCPLHRA